MTLPVSKVVNVSIQVSPTYPQQKGFGLLCIIGSSSNLPTGDRIRFYSDPDGVAADFGANTEEYAAASVFFAQSPRPTELAIARRFAVAVPGELLGSVNCNKKLSDYNAIATGSLSLAVDAQAVNLADIDLGNAASLNAVAAAIQAKLQAVRPNATCIYDGTRFIVRSGTAGAASVVGFAVASGQGTDLAPMLGLRQADHGKSTPGAAAESITDTLNAVQNLNSIWYGFVFTKEITDAQIEDAALWAEGHAKVFGYTTADSNVQDASVDDDLASVLKAANYSRTIGQYDPVDSYAVVSALARAFTVDFTQQNSTITLKFKQEPGIAPISVTSTQAETLKAKNVNYYTYFGSSAMLAEGVMANGRFFDEVYGLDWLQNAIETAVFGYLYAMTTKVPQTDKGVARIVQQVESACQQAVNNGLLAPGTWNGASLGQVATGDFLSKGFYVYAAPVASQSASDRSARKAPPITVLAKGAGAIHSVDITVTFER